MAAPTGGQIAVEVESVEQLFNAPNADPFAASESALLGKAAFDRVLIRDQPLLLDYYLGPLRALLFDWAPQARENGALARVMNMRAVVEESSDPANRSTEA